MKRPLLLLLLLALPVGVGAFAVIASDGGDRGVERPAPVESAKAPVEEADASELIPPPVVRKSVGAVATTVLWPVKVELELLEARFLPKQEGVPPIGTGATARMSGQIMGFDNNGADAEIHFVAGANTGRVLRTDAQGRFGATDLYPGLSIVEVRGARTLGSRRELRLRRGQETLLNIGYGRPGTVVGRVQDATGTGIPEASVTIDGTRVQTDADGVFRLQSVAAGQVLCEVVAEGYAWYQELVWVAGGMTNEDDRMTFTLRPASELTVVLDGNVGGPGPAQVYLFSERKGYTAGSAYRNQAYPWHRLNPVEAWPGRPVTIGNLPPEIVQVHVFRPGAVAQPKTVNLGSSRRDVTLELTPAPRLTGVVKQDGVPVLGAHVRLEAPDRVRAALSYFTEPSYFLETAVIPTLPPSLQETRTDEQGRFAFAAWAHTSPARYLEARGPGGGSWAGRFVDAETTHVELELTDVALGDSVLLLDFPGRHQGLPVDLFIGGSPISSQVLAAEQDLEVSNLVAGRWNLTVSWHAQPVLGPEQVRLEGVERLRVPLPPECIEGQSEEQWRRAGREYPQGL